MPIIVKKAAASAMPAYAGAGHAPVPSGAASIPIDVCDSSASPRKPEAKTKNMTPRIHRGSGTVVAACHIMIAAMMRRGLPSPPVVAMSAK